MAVSVKLHPIVLYQFKNFDTERFVSMYLQEIAPREERRMIPHVPMADWMYERGELTEQEYRLRKAEEQKLADGELIYHKGKSGVRDTTKILFKVAYLQDALIRRANAKKDIRAFSLSSQILKAVIGNEYKPMLDTLRQMEYIDLGDGAHGTAVEEYYYYHAGRHSMIYSICDSVEVKTMKTINATIQKYKEKTSELIAKYREEFIYPDIDRRYGESFRKNYLVSLKQITIRDNEGFQKHIEEELRMNPKSDIYYQYVRSELLSKDKHIQKIDGSGRIYHCLTNLDRELKKYLNIAVSLDSKNSHPLLFNYFIFLNHGISVVDSYRISHFLYTLDSSSLSLHNAGKNIRKYLIDNNVSISEVAKLSNDELKYIHLTSTGRLWDDIVRRHPDMDRNEVKVEMFKQVFYSSTPHAYSWKEYAVEFKEQFPTVYSLIGRWKQRKMDADITGYMTAHNLHPDKPTASLSIAMMNLEAEIFTEILKRMYRKRWRAVHIHDCIIVPDSGSRTQPTREQVLKIMQEVYREHGLCPTFD